MPNQCSFHVYMSTNQTGYNATSFGVTVNYNSETSDVGNNVSNGVFTAPVDGVYMFRAEAYMNADVTQSWFVVNGSRAPGTDIVYDEGSGTQFAHNTAIIKLSEMDTVGYHPYNSSNTSMTINNSVNHTWFKGILIG